jgi:hypothetical protein
MLTKKNSNSKRKERLSSQDYVVVDPLPITTKNGAKIITLQKFSVLTPISLVKPNNPYIILEKDSEEKEEKDVRVIKELIQRNNFPSQIRMGINPDFVEMLGLKIFGEKLIKNQHGAYIPAKKNIYLKYILCWQPPVKPSDKRCKLVRLTTMPKYHRIQMDWNNDEIRLFGIKSDGMWIKVDYSKTGKWENILRKRKKAVLKNHWFRTVEEFS